MSEPGNAAGSDRALKCRIEPVTWPSGPADQAGASGSPDGLPELPVMPTDGNEVLRAVVAMPVSTWSYRGEEDVRHLGPMAQDWYAALGLGSDDRSIHPIDANGVSVVAVQGLYRMVLSLQDEVRELRERLGG